MITDYLLVQTELPLTIAFLIRNRVVIETKNFCVYWNYWYYVWSTMSIQFSMLTAINRYLLIFHKAFLLKYSVFCHYLPMVCIWLYLPCLHLYFIVFFPYGNTNFDYSQVWWGGPQFELIRAYATYDIIFDTWMPLGIIILFNLIMITKVILLKKRARGAIAKWKKNRRMILQLFGICCVQLIGGLPCCIITLGGIYNSPTFGLVIYTQVLIYTFYIPSLCSPFFAIVTMPKAVRDKVTLIFGYPKKEPRASAAPTGTIPLANVDISTRAQLELTNIRQIVTASKDSS